MRVSVVPFVGFVSVVFAVPVVGFVRVIEVQVVVVAMVLFVFDRLCRLSFCVHRETVLRLYR